MRCINLLCAENGGVVRDCALRSLEGTLLVDHVTQLINRSTKLPISLIGRINVLKMSILSKFLYLFQSIPLSPAPSFFKLLNKTTWTQTYLAYFVNDHPTALVAMESQNITVPLHLYMYSAVKKLLFKSTKNTFLKNTIEICYNAIAYWGMTKRLYQFSPIFDQGWEGYF